MLEEKIFQFRFQLLLLQKLVQLSWAGDWQGKGAVPHMVLFFRIRNMQTPAICTKRAANGVSGRRGGSKLGLLSEGI